jgi:hypothetical protein
MAHHKQVGHIKGSTIEVVFVQQPPVMILATISMVKIAVKPT